MNTSVSILFYIKRAKANNLGVCPIYTRVTVNTKRFEFSTNKYINPDKWSSEGSKVKGSYARDIRVCVYDGKMHPVDSNDISFKIAGLQAFRQAFQQADPQILEPIYQLDVLCPDDLTGAVMGDLQSRRAIVEGIDNEGHFQKIIAKVPLAEMDGYSSSLRSITQGRAKFKMKFNGYEAVPFE